FHVWCRRRRCLADPTYAACCAPATPAARQHNTVLHSLRRMRRRFTRSKSPASAFAGRISMKSRAWVVERNGYTCQMCGVAGGDPDPLGGNRTVRLTMGHILDKSKGGDDTPQNLRAVCTNCNQGLQNTALPKPDRIHLLAQIRRATIQDQEAVLDWLLQKFNLQAKKKK
ncbi:MAG: HNH endonuclease, partial [Pyrinomonadaceae bacterium]|nr:HNH endonuclease [Pyrinomonadaceae bacterium]